MKDNIAILLKTYRGDFRYIPRLLDSYIEYNKDEIPLYIVMPEADVELFSKTFQSYVPFIKKIISEETFISDRVKKLNGWKVQQVVKLSFWELGLCDNYFCIDTDSYFIRDFYVNDFMYDEKIPYTILFEDKELKTDPEYRMYWDVRQKQLEKICESIEYYPKKLMTCHGFQIFSTVVLENLKEVFMKEKGYDYVDLLEIAPYEFSWYNFWIQKTEIIPIYICEPLFKTFHLREHQAIAYLRKMTEKDIARAYIGIVVQSNWNPKKTQKYDDMNAEMWLPPKYLGVTCKLYRNTLLKFIPQKLEILKGKFILLGEIVKRDGIKVTLKKLIRFLGGKK